MQHEWSAELTISFLIFTSMTCPLEQLMHLHYIQAPWCRCDSAWGCYCHVHINDIFILSVPEWGGGGLALETAFTCGSTAKRGMTVSAYRAETTVLFKRQLMKH